MIIQQVPYSEKNLIEFLGVQESQHVAWGNHYEDELVARILDGDQITGSRLPWQETHDNLCFRPGEVTLWAGMNGHHKSMIVGQVMQWFALDGDRVGIMSFEMAVIATMHRMVCQASGSMDPAEPFARKWAKWNEDRICYYDKLDTTPSDKVLGTIYYMAKDLGCKHILIDSLTKCGLPYGERGAEKDFVDILSATAKAFKIHIHLVCHVRKPDKRGEDYRPNKFDIRGAGELTDLVDNVIICWTDKKRATIKKAMEFGKTIDEQDREYHDNNPDQRLIVAKQRHWPYEGTIGLYKHPSTQFTKVENKALPFDMEAANAG